MTITEICNKALSHLGESRITDFHEASVVGEKCRTHFDAERDSLLRMHRWNFAEDRAILARLQSAPVFGYLYQFQLPVDCLRVVVVNGVEARKGYNPWRIEGQRLLSDAKQAEIVYTRRETDTTLFDPLFVEAMTYKLAAALAKELTNSTSEKGAMLQLFREAMNEAGWVDASESRPRVIPPETDNRLLMVRMGSK